MQIGEHHISVRVAEVLMGVGKVVGDGDGMSGMLENTVRWGQLFGPAGRSMHLNTCIYHLRIRPSAS